MGFFLSIWNALKDIFKAIGNLVKAIIVGILNFVKQVLNYFRGLLLDPKKDTPFIIDAKVLREQITNAPRVDVGLFQAVYHEETNTITDYQLIEAKEFDEQTEKVMSQAEDGIVVLQ